MPFQHPVPEFQDLFERFLSMDAAMSVSTLAFEQRRYGRSSSGRKKRGPTRIVAKSRRSVVSTR